MELSVYHIAVTVKFYSKSDNNKLFSDEDLRMF